MRLTVRAPGKVNLCLFLGPVREDGRHEVVTVLESVSLADSIEVTWADSIEVTPGRPSGDQVVCPGIDGLNIVAQTLDGLRERGWNGPPLRVAIEKRIPVAAGMGGGSADAAAVLRLASRLAPISPDAVAKLAASLGTDVPSQLAPGVGIGTGAGEVIERRPGLGPHAFVIVPQPFALSTAEVYREADRMGLPRRAEELTARHAEVRAATWPPFVNDLEPAAISLRPEIGRALAAVRETGASAAMVSGSGPTVFGLFDGVDASARAEAAASCLVDRYPGATSAVPVSEEFGAPRGT